MIQPGDLKQLPHQSRQAADAHLSALIAQLLGNLHDRTEPHAAHIGETAKVNDKAVKPLRDADFALAFKSSGVLSIHAAGHMQYKLVSNLGSFDGHNTRKSALHRGQRQSRKL